jgi:hypothetical protein
MVIRGRGFFSIFLKVLLMKILTFWSIVVDAMQDVGLLQGQMRRVNGAGSDFFLFYSFLVVIISEFGHFHSILPL